MKAFQLKEILMILASTREWLLDHPATLYGEEAEHAELVSDLERACRILTNKKEE